MPARLRPTAPIAADAILVGDPGRALLLAQELLGQPKMSNHARGLWGYGGQTPAGRELTIQATGMGGPSAAIVLADLAELGVGRAVRIGTCSGLAGQAVPGELLLTTAAVAVGGSATSFGLEPGLSMAPDSELLTRLAGALGDSGRKAAVASLDTIAGEPHELPGGAVAADMQTVAVLARARQLGVAAAALLIVSEVAGERLAEEELESAAKKAGATVVEALSNPQVEG